MRGSNLSMIENRVDAIEVIARLRAQFSLHLLNTVILRAHANTTVLESPAAGHQCKLQGTGCRPQGRAASFMRQAQGCKLQAAHPLQATGCSTSYRLQATSYRVQGTSYRLQATTGPLSPWSLILPWFLNLGPWSLELVELVFGVASGGS